MLHRTDVFSTSVEVFPSSVSSMNGHVSLLHVRGGVSILNSLLHVRGGVSRTAECTLASLVSSPHPWRCLNISVPGVVVVYSRELSGANCS